MNKFLKLIFGSKGGSVSGSIALEASFAVPFFLWFIMTLLMSLEAVRLQSNVLEALCEGISAAYESGLSSSGPGTAQSYMKEQERMYLVSKGGIAVKDASTVSADGILNLKAEYAIRPFLDRMPIGNLMIRDELFGHAFTGYVRDFAFGTEEAVEEYVYVTATGTKYHRDAACSYIRITPIAVNASYLEAGRNSSGGKYYPCERCRPSAAGTIFLTRDGDRYHSDSACSALRRTVYLKTLTEALDAGYTPCFKCG